MRRRLLNLLTALSLLLCAAVVALWVGGYRRAEFFRWGNERTELRVESSRGNVALAREWINPHRGTFYARFFYSVADPLPLDAWSSTSGVRRWSLGGLTWYAQGQVDSGDPFVTRSVELPAWHLAIVFATLPGMRGWKRTFRRRLTAAGLCPRCGYDLRATPDRCPECGATTLTTR